MSGGAIFEYGWREDHARAGDEALRKAEVAVQILGDRGVMPMSDIISGSAQVQSLAAIAQAHYAAANVRTRPIRDAELPAG